MPNPDDQVRREAGVHGTRWAGMHQGYFSHPAIADPLVHAAAELVARDNPAVVADLGRRDGYGPPADPPGAPGVPSGDGGR